MNKFMTEMHKDVEKYIDNGFMHKGRPKFVISNGFTDDCMGFIKDGHVVYFAHKDEISVNIENPYFTSQNPMDVRRIVSTVGLKSFKVTGGLEITPRNITIMQLKADDGEELWINADNVKYFENKYTKLSDYELEAYDWKSPLFLKKDGNILGMILPVNHK